SMWAFLTEINRNGTTIILTTHYLEEAEQLCRNIALIDEGRIIENTSMKKLLAELDTQVFVLDTVSELDRDIDVQMENLSIQSIDRQYLEVTISGGKQINEAFLVLSEQGINIASMSNKSNRLEQLVLSRLQNNGS
ncbi:MAG: ABC transporter ATP-binding protein, partial [Pseudomonadales bacterium]